MNVLKGKILWFLILFSKVIFIFLKTNKQNFFKLLIYLLKNH